MEVSIGFTCVVLLVVVAAFVAGCYRGKSRGRHAEAKLQSVRRLFEQEAERAEANGEIVANLIYQRAVGYLAPGKAVPPCPWPRPPPTHRPKRRDSETWKNAVTSRNK